MRLKGKTIGISTGGPLVVIINESDSNYLDVYKGDRLEIKNDGNKAVAIADIGLKGVISKGVIGLFQETAKKLNYKKSKNLCVKIVEKPVSINYIRKKLDGGKLTYGEIKRIIQDIVDNKLSEVELAYFVAGSYTNNLDDQEVLALTNAMIETGDRLKLRNKIVIDKHCIGGVVGNRTTMIIVPIIAVAGLKIPKTSSKSITSPAGTADTMGVLSNITFKLSKIKKVVSKTGGCIVWGGSMNLAPADDKIISVERPLNLDAKNHFLASILAKKISVSATHVLIDIPIGKGAKIESRKEAELLKKDFEIIGKKLGTTIKIIITDGSEPIGRGIGPVLEVLEVLKVLKGEESNNFLKKSVEMAGIMLEMGGKANKGEGKAKALKILESGKAYAKFQEIIKAQGGKTINLSSLKLGKYTYEMKSLKKGIVKHLDNKTLSKTAKMAGAPNDQMAGIYLNKVKGDKVVKGETILTIYANNKEKLKFAIERLNGFEGIIIK